MTYNYNDRVTTSEGNGAVKSDGLVNCRGIVYSVLIDNAEFETHFYVHELEPERDIHKEIKANCKAKADATKPISKYTKDFIDKAKETKSTPAKPDHYKSPIDVIEFCKLNDLDFVQGNVIKYIVRYKKKNGLEDLKKAQENINRLISDYNE